MEISVGHAAFCTLDHVFKRVVLVDHGVVGVDAHETDAFALTGFGHGVDSSHACHDVRAVIAFEQHQRTVGTGGVRKRNVVATNGSVSVGEVEVGRSISGLKGHEVPSRLMGQNGLLCGGSQDEHRCGSTGDGQHGEDRQQKFPPTTARCWVHGR